MPRHGQGRGILHTGFENPPGPRRERGRAAVSGRRGVARVLRESLGRLKESGKIRACPIEGGVRTGLISRWSDSRETPSSSRSAQRRRFEGQQAIGRDGRNPAPRRSRLRYGTPRSPPHSAWSVKGPSCTQVNTRAEAAIALVLIVEVELRLEGRAADTELLLRLALRACLVRLTGRRTTPPAARSQ